MNLFLIGEAANHRPVLESALGGAYQIIDLPREAATSPAYDSDIGAADVVVSLRFSRRDTPAPAFRLLHVPGAGLDGIDFKTLPACGVCNVFEHETPIAEYVMAAMLEQEIGFSRMRDQFSAVDWPDQYRARVPHGELCGKVLGVIGYGRIGAAIARRAAAFGMRVLALDPVAGSSDPGVEVVRPQQLPGLLAQADYVAIACPLNGATRGMFNTAALSSMKRTAVLINVSRAEIAVEQDLYAALENGTIGGAVLDVWYQYPKGTTDRVPPSALPFADLPNVTATPHSSAWTRDLPGRRYRFIAQNLLRLQRGEPLHNVVRPLP